MNCFRFRKDVIKLAGLSNTKLCNIGCLEPFTMLPLIT